MIGFQGLLEVKQILLCGLGICVVFLSLSFLAWFLWSCIVLPLLLMFLILILIVLFLFPFFRLTIFKTGYIILLMLANIPCFLWAIFLLFLVAIATSLRLSLYLIYKQRLADCIMHREGIVKGFLIGFIGGYFYSILFGLSFVLAFLTLLFSWHKALLVFIFINFLSILLSYKPFKKMVLSYTYPDLAFYVISKFLPWIVLIPLSVLYATYMYNTLTLGEFLTSLNAIEYEKHLSEQYLKGYSCELIGFFAYFINFIDYLVKSLHLRAASEFEFGFVFIIFLLIKEGLSVWVINSFVTKILAVRDAK